MKRSLFFGKKRLLSPLNPIPGADPNRTLQMSALFGCFPSSHACCRSKLQLRASPAGKRLENRISLQRAFIGARSRGQVRETERHRTLCGTMSDVSRASPVMLPDKCVLLKVGTGYLKRNAANICNAHAFCRSYYRLKFLGGKGVRGKPPVFSKRGGFPRNKNPVCPLTNGAGCGKM